ncbi:hypothetical protein MBLNU459_g0604t1 [Dothideomycetes sp. NU459]
MAPRPPQSVDQYFDMSRSNSPQSSQTTIDPVLQVTPKSKHASSGYHYPTLLVDYGVSEADWEMFTSQFMAANTPSRNQLLAMSCLTLGLEMFFLAGGFGIFTLPFATLTAAALADLPTYFWMKRRNLRRHVRNGNIPAWLDAYNDQYFGPKGLRVAFALPGSRLPDTEVAPKRRVRSLALGEFKAPMRTERAARRARIVVVEAREPRAGMGQVPLLKPMATSRVYQVLQQGSVKWTVDRIKLYRARTAGLREQRARSLLLEAEGVETRSEMAA